MILISTPMKPLALVKSYQWTAFHRRALLGLMVSGLVILAMMRFSFVDFAIEDIYFDAQQQVFPWKHTWFAETLMHEHIKVALQSIGILVCGLTLSDWIKPWFSSQWVRVRLRFVALSAVLIPLVITLFKRTNALHCPWDIDRYGGAYPHLNPLSAIPTSMPYGHCFPAGHASTGLWLAAFAVFWLPHQPKRAWLIAGFGLLVGFVLGWVQQMRGAHFLTHTLMSVWLSCCILLILNIFTPQLEEK